MKGRLLKKLKSIPTISTLKQGLILQFNPSEKLPNQNFQNPPVHKEQEQPVPGNTAVSEFVKDHKDEEAESGIHIRDKENLTPAVNSNDIPISSDSESDDLQTLSLSDAGVLTESRTCSFQLDPSPEIDISSFQRQGLNLRSLFNQGDEPANSHEANENNEEHLSLLDFEAKCPPEGNNSIIFYTTSLRGIRKTFENCNAIRFLLESFRVLFHERDVSMHEEFKEELWRIMGGRVVPPRLFIKGRYIGGTDEVIGLHEQGKLRKLFRGIPLNESNRPCNGCAGVRFVLCLNCNGSRRVFTDEGDDGLFIRCCQCNENGLVKCPICC